MEIGRDGGAVDKDASQTRAVMWVAKKPWARFACSGAAESRAVRTDPLLRKDEQSRSRHLGVRQGTGQEFSGCFRRNWLREQISLPKVAT